LLLTTAVGPQRTTIERSAPFLIQASKTSRHPLKEAMHTTVLFALPIIPNLCKHGQSIRPG